ncbi:hypothetical protein J1605_001068 [Eschrichtius robustus]|uniref:Uncharacterized protein n=1 Tax=Eschrichtius robustus TaxID=9764 RepID=A0AB34GQQ4_ESCRO|nr:hypothetical protein J1605_001068 [Eschrichtius robustus]
MPPALLSCSPHREITGVGAGPSWCPLPLWAGPFSTSVGRLRAKEELSKTAAQPTSAGSCRPAERPGAARQSDGLRTAGSGRPRPKPLDCIPALGRDE